MNMASLDVGGVRVFEARQRVGLQAALCIAGGVLFFLMLIVMFLIALGSKSTTSNDMMPGMIGGLSVFGIGLIGRGIFLLRGVVRVTLDNNAVHLDGFTARRTVSYQQIERIERDKKNQLLGGKTHQVLLLYAAGERKPLAIIPDTIENFEELATELARRSAAAQGGRTTYDPIADQQIRDRRDSRRMKFTSAAFSVITLLFIVMLCFGVNEEIHNRRLQSRGTAVYARIDKHFMRSVTPYIEYSFADAQGKRQSREVMVTELLYGQTREGQLVPVVYLADQPEWNRLVGGEAGKNFGGKFLFLLGGGTLMFGAFAVMTLLGIDIKSENGRTTIVRRGKVIREFGAKPLETPAFPVLPRFDAVHAPSAATQAPPPPIAAAAAPPPAKPTGLLVLGVLCLVFGLIGTGFGVLRWLMDAAMRTQTVKRRAQTLVVDQPAWAGYWFFADAALAAALMLVGVGLLMLTRWSRSIGIPVAVLQILSSLGSAAMIIASMAHNPEPDGPNAMTPVAFNIAAIVFRLLTAVFPAVLLYVLTRRSTVETLR